MAYFNGRDERERKERETPERILQIARTKGYFRVSLRYRDDWLRERCGKLRREGLLTGGRREGRVMGGKEGTALFLVFRDDSYNIKHAWAGIVGKDGIEPEVWYTLNSDGKPIKAA